MKQYIFTRLVISNKTFQKDDIVTLTPSQVSVFKAAKAIKLYVKPKTETKEDANVQS